MSQEQQAKTICALIDDSGNFIYTESVGVMNCDNVRFFISEKIRSFNKNQKTFFVDYQNGVFEIIRVNAEGKNYFLCLYHHGLKGDEHSRLLSMGRKVMELEAIFEASHDGLVVADACGTYLNINNNYENITGIAPNEIIGRSSHEIVDEGFVSDSPTYKVIETSKPQSLTQIFRTGRMSHITATPVFDENGKLFRVVVNVRDTTELYKLREELNSSREKLDQYAKLVSDLTNGGDRIFNSPSMRKIKAMAIRFAQVDAHLLITGETGVGKEVVTDLVHKHSIRKDGPFIKINCSAIPESLLESQLFGYAEGAFTGAKKEGSKGLLEMAHNGTAFLDEVSEIPLSVQVKLLRFIQQKEFYRVGGKKVRKVDVRIIAATNRDLEKMVKEKAFRNDLYYRLNVLKLIIPPLRKRKMDIYPLANLFLSQCNTRYNMNKSFSPALYHLLLDYDWPGNVRELENLVERLVVVSGDDVIQPDCLPENMLADLAKKNGPTMSDVRLTYRQAKDEFERNFWQEALSKHGSFRRTAAAVGVDHSTVVKKASRYKLDCGCTKLRKEPTG